MALEVESAAHLATNGQHINGESQYTDANANRLPASNLKSLENTLHTEVFPFFNDYLQCVEADGDYS